MEELLKPRIFGIRVFDTSLTAVAAYFVSQRFHQNFWIVFLALVVIGELTHAALGIKTAGLKKLNELSGSF